jgi:hypothetical protein
LEPAGATGMVGSVGLEPVGTGDGDGGLEDVAG